MLRTTRTHQRLQIESLERREMLSISPQAVGDLNQGGAPYLELQSDNAWLDNEVLFAADDGNGDVELWKSDGTPDGTVRVKDIRIGDSGSLPRGFLSAGDQVLFTAYSDEFGRELWTTDGTEQGTVLLADLAPGATSPHLGSFTHVGDDLYFRRSQELWITDGTASGTAALTSIAVESLTPFNDRLYFSAEVQSGETQLWMSDGAAEGTTVLSHELVPHRIVVADNLLYVLSTDELWVSDGSVEGTRRVTSIPSPSLLAVAGDNLFFFDYEPPDWGQNGSTWRLWHSDGTANGTGPIGSLSVSPTGFTAIGDQVFYSDDRNGLWVSDGTIDGTERIMSFDSRISRMNSSEKRLLFTLWNTHEEREFVTLWQSDGTADGTTPVPGMEQLDVDVHSLREMSGMLYVDGIDANGEQESWRTDGTDSGTEKLERTESLGNDFWVMARGQQSTFLWSGAGDETAGLWARDKNGEALTQIQTTIRGPSAGTAHEGYGEANLHHVADRILYVERQALWQVDGSVFNLIETPAISNDTRDRLVMDDHLYFFTFEDFGSRKELWRTDGTKAGTVRLMEADERIRSPWGLTSVGDAIYFRAAGGSVWKFDKSESQAVEVEDLKYPPVRFNDGSILFRDVEEGNTEIWRANASAEPQEFLAVVPTSGHVDAIEPMIADRQLFMMVDGQTLWRSDGTVEGTHWLADEIISRSPVVAGNSLFFQKETTFYGDEVWVSDGTVEGTHLTRDIVPGRAGCGAANIVASGGEIFFSASDAAGNPGLWRSDGTEGGTTLVKNIVAYPIAAGDGVIYFDGIEPSTGRELWKSDGTPEGTVLIADLNPGPGDSRRGKTIGAPPAAPVAEIDGHLYFTANDGFHGYELWQVPVGSQTQSVPGDANRDGVFNSSDLVLVFQRGKYEDNIDDNSSWEDGDWNGDGDFNFTDLVLAFQSGGYQTAAAMNAIQTDIASLLDWTNDSDRKRLVSLEPDSTDEIFHSLWE